MDFSKLLEWMKLSPKYLFPISLVTGFALFAPPAYLEIFGIAFLVVQIRSYLGVVFLLSTTLLVTYLLTSSFPWARNKYQEYDYFKALQKRLHSLTNDEKRILQYFINNQTRTQYLSIQDGIVSGLELENVIFKSSKFGRGLDKWAYNIQPWAWEYLENHRELLALNQKDIPNDENSYHGQSRR